MRRWIVTNEDTKIEEAFKKCADVRLPADFADRLVKRVQADRKRRRKASVKSDFIRIALVAASLTLLLGFVPGVLDRSRDRRTEIAVHCDEIRAAGATLPQDSQLNALAFLGFCREVIRRRVRPLLARGRRREEEQ